MSTPLCSICKAGVSLVRYVDASPDLTAAALSRQAALVGMGLSAERILTHRKHRKAEEPASIAKNKRDFAIVVRDRALSMMDSEELALDNKDLVPGINAGLKAQSIIDSREKQKAKHGSAELAFAIIQMLSGRSPDVPQLEDGNTIEGEFEEVDGESVEP